MRMRTIFWNNFFEKAIKYVEECSSDIIYGTIKYDPDLDKRKQSDKTLVFVSKKGSLTYRVDVDISLR